MICFNCIKTYNYISLLQTNIFLVLKFIITPLIIYQEKYFIQNFDNIIKPYFKGNVNIRNSKINLNSKNQYSLLSNQLTKDILEDLRKKKSK